MAMRKILVDETNRELCEHGTVGFPMTVNHDDLWAFEGKNLSTGTMTWRSVFPEKEKLSIRCIRKATL
jgi:hypothetical protein